MEFENGRVILNYMKIEGILLVAFGSLFSLAFLDVYQNPYLPLENYQYGILIFLIFVLGGYLWHSLYHTYISFNSKSDTIVIKYFRLMPKIIKPKPKMIKIPKSSYVKYEIKTSYFGKRKALYLFQKTAKGVVKYPPIYINSLNDTEMYKLKQALKF